MRLLFFIHGLSGGGAERVMATLMNGFVKQGHQVRVVYTASMEDSVYTLNHSIDQVFLLNECKRNSSSLVDRIYRRIWKYPAIRRHAKRYNPNFVISFIKTHNNYVLASLLGLGVPVVISDHTNVNRRYPFLTRLASKILYPSAAAITMLTYRDYQLWKNKYKHVYYLPNPCDIKSIIIKQQRQNIILGIGRVDQWRIKGFDNLIRAWAKICDKFPSWKCQIAGAYSKARIEELRAEVGDDSFNRVEFIGFRSDIYQYMESCEVFCLSSRTEGMPMALLEALNLGCACVAFDCVTGPAEMIEDGKTGLLVKDQDVEDLARKLENIITNEDLRIQFHQNAPASVERFSIENILKMWIHMFEELKSHN